MIELIFVALFQAAAGAPETPNADPAAPASTTQPAAQTAAAGAQATQQEEPLRCRREPIMGTRLARRICTTASEDQVITDESRDMVNRMQSVIPAGPAN